ncbi:MAG: hypothetical protein Q8N18_12725 [Opitutaceae bacterium]|nr:hypothetical protein [Opitutaceae bacterium]
MLQRVLDWVLGNLPIVIFAVVVISQMIRAAKRAKEQAADEPQARPDVLEEDRRTRDVQEQVRRRIAERRGGVATATPPPVPAARPVANPETTQLPEVFDGPLGRMLQELQKRGEPAAPAAPPMMAEVRGSHAVELERQERLAEELRSLEGSRALAKRRAAAITAGQVAVAQTSSGQLLAARDRLLSDLRSPGSLRRAVVLREVLGAPVALR